uniref:LIM zinc-binding domain-containing protein n=2 Tax=Clytia hemisphaerica TaxID=252671 RepID=A0A7M5XP73_9CNID
FSGVCAQCEEAIHGEVCTAFGKTWHPYHFLCEVCGNELWQQMFYEREGKAYCEKDYTEKYSPKCEACKEIITDACIMENKRVWHLEHFKCSECKQLIDTETGFHDHQEQIYCTGCYQRLFLPVCPVCKTYVHGIVMNGKFHQKCFKCADCRHSLEGKNYYEHEGRIYCETHFRAKRRNICAKCNKLIIKSFITAMGGKKFHPEHFTCSLCTFELNNGTYKEAKGRPYCEKCYLKTFMRY